MGIHCIYIMSLENKKSFKKTTALQFAKLIAYMEEFPHLATGSPKLASSKSAMENTWDTIALKLNTYGPPQRNGGEWKKVWHDQKFRLKKKIAENNKNLRGTGGGPCKINYLTAMETEVDRICNFSSATVPSGKCFGISTAIKPIKLPSNTNKNVNFTPSDKNGNVVITLSTTSEVTEEQAAQNGTKGSEYPEISAVSSSNKLLPSESVALQEPQLPTAITSTLAQTLTKQTNSETVRERSFYPSHCKRKLSKKDEQIQLLRKQLEVQETALHAINDQAEAAKVSAAAGKEIAESIKTISQSLVAIVKHLSDDL